MIERFPEDIDLILDWSLLTEEDPYKARSNTQQDKFNKQIEVKAQAYTADTLYQDLLEAFAGIGELQTVEGQKELVFQYPKAFDAAYIRPEILIEVSPMSAMAPKREVVVRSYSAECFSDLFDDSKVTVQTIEARKTFWDKVTILHAEAHRPEAKALLARYSRHYYDVYQMLGSWVKGDAMADLNLLKSVAAFKHQFYPQQWANYIAIQDGRVKLAPGNAANKNLQQDYASMQEMIHGDYPEFSKIMSVISLFEVELNRALSK